TMEVDPQPPLQPDGFGFRKKREGLAGEGLEQRETSSMIADLRENRAQFQEDGQAPPDVSTYEMRQRNLQQRRRALVLAGAPEADRRPGGAPEPGLRPSGEEEMP